MAKKPKAPERDRSAMKVERVNVTVKKVYTESNEHPEKTSQELIKDRGTSRQQWMLFVTLLLGVLLVVLDAFSDAFTQPVVATVPLGYAMVLISLIGLAGREVAQAISSVLSKMKGR